MGNLKRCPYCGAELGIEAEHTYKLAQTIHGRWVKCVGYVTYTCRECEAELSVSDIKEALEQTDEL